MVIRLSAAPVLLGELVMRDNELFIYRPFSRKYIFIVNAWNTHRPQVVLNTSRGGYRVIVPQTTMGPSGGMAGGGGGGGGGAVFLHIITSKLHNQKFKHCYGM